MPNKYGKAYTVDASDVRNAFAQIGATEFVKGNPSYREVYDGVYLHVEAGDDLVNAFCCTLNDTFRKYLAEEAPGVNWGRYGHLLLVTAGMLRWVSVVAAVCEYVDRTRKLGEAKRMLSWAAARLTRHSAGSDFVKRFADEFSLECDGRREEVARMYAMSILVALLGHELGHASLHHDSCGMNSISRNDERQADLFASSVAQSMGNGYAGAVGGAVLMLSFLWMGGRYSRYVSREDLRNPDKYSTHPVDIERIRSFIESFNTVLDLAPINTKMLMKLARKA